jgi:hypothetical protein
VGGVTGISLIFFTEVKHIGLKNSPSSQGMLARKKYALLPGRAKGHGVETGSYFIFIN